MCGGDSPWAWYGAVMASKSSLGFTPLWLMNHFLKPVAHCEWPLATFLWLSSLSGHNIYSCKSNDHIYDWVWIACGTGPLQRFSPAIVPWCTAFTASCTAEWSQKEIIHVFMYFWNLNEPVTAQLNKWLVCIMEKTVAKVPAESFTSLPAFCHHPFVVATTGRG